MKIGENLKESKLCSNLLNCSLMSISQVGMSTESDLLTFPPLMQPQHHLSPPHTQLRPSPFAIPVAGETDPMMACHAGPGGRAGSTWDWT